MYDHDLLILTTVEGVQSFIGAIHVVGAPFLIEEILDTPLSHLRLELQFHVKRSTRQLKFLQRTFESFRLRHRFGELRMFQDEEEMVSHELYSYMYNGPDEYAFKSVIMDLQQKSKEQYLLGRYREA